MSSNGSVIELIHLILDDLDLCYQCFQLEDYEYRGKIYQYLPFQTEHPDRNIELDNASIKLEISNLEVIREAVREYDGLRRAIVRITTIFPDSNTAPPITELTQISQTTFQYDRITFDLQSPLNAVNAQIPSVYFTLRDFPEVPLSTNPRLS